MDKRAWWAALLAMFMMVGCVVSTERVPGEPGPPGEQGPPGDDGATATIVESACTTGDYVTGIHASGAIVCAPGPDTSALQQQVEVLQTQITSLQAALDAIEDRWVELPGVGTGPDMDLPIPQSQLGGVYRTVLLTVRADAQSCILARTYLLHTGGQSGAFAEPLGTVASYNVGSVSVTNNLGFGAFNNNPELAGDVARGVTVTFSGMPASFNYRVTITRIGTQQ